jgi:hypothetical protein
MTSVNKLMESLLDEGFARGQAGQYGNYAFNMGSEVISWFRTNESKFNNVKVKVTELLDWLHQAKQDHPNLNLQTNALLNWFKTSESFTWRFYPIINNSVYSKLVADMRSKDKKIGLVASSNIVARHEAVQVFNNAKSIDDLVKIVKMFQDRVNETVELLQHHEVFFMPQTLHNAVMDLEVTIKKVVRLAI